MKNLKNTVATVGLMGIILMGSMTANAGIYASDSVRGSDPKQCGGSEQLSGLKGIIRGIEAILMSDYFKVRISIKSSCSEGILMGDSQKAGIIASD